MVKLDLIDFYLTGFASVTELLDFTTFSNSLNPLKQFPHREDKSAFPSLETTYVKPPSLLGAGIVT